MDRSATRRVAPSGLLIDAVLNDRGNGRIAIRYREHLALSGLVVLSIIFGEIDVVTFVMVACRLAIRTSRLCVHDYGHCSKLHL